MPEVFSCFFTTWRSSFVISILKQCFRVFKDDEPSKPSNVTSSSYALTLILPSSTSMITIAIFMKGLPRIKGTSVSSSISIITKFIGKVNPPTFIITFSTTPWGYLRDLSTRSNVILIDQASRFQIPFIINNDTKLMLTSKSNRAFHTDKS